MWVHKDGKAVNLDNIVLMRKEEDVKLLSFWGASEGAVVKFKYESQEVRDAAYLYIANSLINARKV